ncbi:choice-of-anchor I family protein [Granulicoccus sp. GXG6511]|uniref:choice-of-anchor I family protein n=1 Tax=Granulicoccus sp. GXG6511 TaxID=3381351 RepID=UPI003D7EED4A
MLRRLAALAVATSACAALTVPALAVTEPIVHSAPDAALSVTPLGTYATGVFAQSAAEIVAFHAKTQRLFVVNAAAGQVDVLDGRDAAAPTKLFDLQTAEVQSEDGSVIPAGAVANSVAIRPDGLGVIAVEAPDKTDNGWVVFFDATADRNATLGAVRVGALPDMLTFTPDGKQILVANEGEPAEDYSVDPEGSISVIKAPPQVRAGKQNQVKTADFRAFEGKLPAGVRIFGPAGTDAQNLEPEYITVDGRSKKAYVTLQENNAIAVVNLDQARVERILPLGTQDLAQVAMDVSDRDQAINIATWPGVESFLLPDAIASYEVGGRTYLVTANEGDARDWDAFSEEARVKDLGKDGLKPICADAPAYAHRTDAELGRLTITTTAGLNAEGTCYETLYAFGGRSFSIFDTDGNRVFDSGSQFEEITAAAIPEFFNYNHEENAFDNRSDNKGPEPEGVVVGEVDGRTYAFIGFERIGGVIVYDVTDPRAAEFVTYVNNRDFSADPETAAAGDLGPEGLALVPASDSPTGRPMLVIGNEVSGTTTTFDIR